jgi:pimeloyl-ACP methyl ester carboxylesterase
MREKVAFAIVLAATAMPYAARAETPQVTEIEFQSEGSTVRGRFFSTADEPIATVVFLPGADFDPTDVLGLGESLSALGVNVVTFAARGTRGSEGTLSIAGAVADVGAALGWLRGADGRALRVDPDRIVIGGHSLGGGIAMAYAARDPSVRNVISIAGNDLGEYARRLRGNPALAAGLRGRLSEMSGSTGFAHLDPDAVVREILDNEALYGHPENASRLADRTILLVGGWDDSTAPIETVLIPFYRALKRQADSHVTLIVYPDGHFFRESRQEMAADIRAWLGRHIF